MPAVVFSKLKPVVFTGFQRSLTGKQVPLSDSASSLLRQLKFLSVNSGLIQSFSYSGKSLSDNRCIRNLFCLRAKTMAVSSSKAVFGDVYMDELVASCGNGLDFLKPSGVYFADRMQRNTGYNLPFGPRMKNIDTSSLSCTSSRAAHDLSFDGSSKDERAATIPNKKSFRLVSGSCYLPHPAKEETGGEDAHFICANDEAIGVADGVGGWVEVGVDAGEFARELMCNSVAAIQDEPKGSIDPARVLEKAHSSTKSQGSSTACIIALTEEGIHAINLGDSGFIVVRDGCTVYHSPSGDGGDLPSSGQVFKIPVLSGDVIIAGTDGLFDNLYNNEITAAVVHGLRAGFNPQLMAKQIATLARERAMDKNRQTPFAKAAQDAGFRYYGGKLDDITVVVSYIAGSSNT
ncbi:hypothetical protein E1A91_A11G200800v1 [Gossypium mustelinum]|uniref:Protein phosphatase n=1 Tax=Gossypium mustelinum TaxID=34275 RepID=A0A5D2XBY1_GOSMU|nr:hypothetical protein E1A91_A11G200800v1 [Gossypium mustelinum]